MTDILDIEEAGFDAIALNLGSYEKFPSFRPETSDPYQNVTSDCWQQNSVELAYQAVNKLRSPVKLFLSLDMFVFNFFLSYAQPMTFILTGACGHKPTPMTLRH